MLKIVIETLRGMARARAVPLDLADRPLAADTLIDDLAIDSLGKLNLIGELEERADVALSEAMLDGLRTLGDLARVLETARGSAA